MNREIYRSERISINYVEKVLLQIEYMVKNVLFVKTSKIHSFDWTLCPYT